MIPKIFQNTLSTDEWPSAMKLINLIKEVQDALFKIDFDAW